MYLEHYSIKGTKTTLCGIACSGEFDGWNGSKAKRRCKECLHTLAQLEGTEAPVEQPRELQQHYSLRNRAFTACGILCAPQAQDGWIEGNHANSSCGICESAAIELELADTRLRVSLDSAERELQEPVARPAPVEAVNNPAHYGGADNCYEAIKVIDAWQLSFCLGNTVKYINRAGKKDAAKKLEDLRKARWYLDHEISQLEATNTK